MTSARTVAVASTTVMLGTLVLRCALFPSTDDLTGGGLPAGDAGAGDVLDSALPDTGARDAGDAEAGRFCEGLSPQPQFCDDFDGAQLGLWTSTDFTNGSSVTRDGTDVRSAPNALLTVTPGGAIQQARVVLNVPAFKKLHVAYDVRIDERGTYAEIGYVRVQGPGIQNLYYFRAEALPTAVAFAAEAYPPDAGLQVHDVSLTGAPTFESWTHVDLDLDLAPSPGLVTIRLDGNVAATQSLESGLYVQGAGQVEVGTGYTDSTSTEFRIRYDNATIDWN